MARQKRNERCACGSGKKFKACHGGQKQRDAGDTPVSRLKFGLAMAVVAVLVIWAGFAMFGSAPAGGAAVAGRVWSAEHGHYHDAQGGELAPASTSGGAPGQVWSEEHGHFH